MPTSVDDLLPQEMLTFFPRLGVFDLDAVRAAFAKIGFPFQDDGDPNRYGFTVTAQSRDNMQAARRADPAGTFPMILLVDLAPDKITVSPVSYSDGQAALSRQVLEWLTATYDCFIENELGADIS